MAKGRRAVSENEPVWFGLDPLTHLHRALAWEEGQSQKVLRCCWIVTYYEPLVRNQRTCCERVGGAGDDDDVDVDVVAAGQRLEVRKDMNWREMKVKRKGEIAWVSSRKVRPFVGAGEGDSRSLRLGNSEDARHAV